MAVCGLWILCGISLPALVVYSGLSIRGCEQGSAEAVEDSDPFFTCGEYWIQGPQWTVYTDEGKTFYTGSCNKGSCTPSNNQFRLNDVKHENRNMYTSRLTIEKITRDLASKLVCSDSSTRASCDLRIIVPPLYKARSCSVYISNWMVTGRCTLTRMFSSDNNYTCGWTQNNNEEEFGSVQIKPENYTERNSKSYVNGVCLFTKTMPVDDGNYTYSMKVSLNAGPYFEETLYIAKPYAVKLNHSCPNHVFEGSNVSCKCSALSTGSPPAQIEWDGMQNATLLLKVVSREMNEDQFTCRMTWGPNGFINETIVFNLNVAYGPSEISIKSSKETSYEKIQTVLKCAAIDVYPSAEFHWNISCDNETYTVNTSTCILPSASVHDGMTVACTASNKIFKNVSLSGFFVLNIAKHNGQEVIIGGVVSAAGIIAVIVALIVVYHVKRRNTANKTDTPVVRYYEPSCDQYTITSTTTSGHANSDEYVTSRETIQNESCATEMSGDYQGRNTNQQVNQREEKAKNTAQPQPSSTGNQQFQDLSATSFMNFTEAATNLAVDVYHTVTRAAVFGKKGSYTTQSTDTTVVLEDEYNVLHFQEDRTGQEDYAATYSHLDFE